MTSCAQCGTVMDDQARFCGACGCASKADDEPASSETHHEHAVRLLLERRNDGVLANLAKQFRALRWGSVLPLARWWRDRPWKLVWVKWFLFFALFPLGLAVFFAGDGVSLELAASALGFYFAVLWGFVLRLCLLPEQAGRRLVLKVVLFTLICSGALLALAHSVAWIEAAYQHRQSEGVWMRLVGYTVGVGLVEEVVKAFAIYWFAYRNKLELRPVTYSYLGALSGLAFGVSEAVDYSIRYMTQHLAELAKSFEATTDGELAWRVEHAYGEYLLSEFLRMITLPLLHAVLAGLTCFFVGVALRHRHARHALILVGLSISTLFHGAYDALDGWKSLGIAALLLTVYVAYVRSEDLLASGAARPDPSPAGAAIKIPSIRAQNVAQP